MVATNEFSANIELQHIYLEAYSERYHSLRQYFEAYYCYRHNLVTRQGKPDWLQIFHFARPSMKASACKTRKETVRELALPLSVITGKLKALVRDEELTVEAIAEILDEHLEYVILSRFEWQKLCQLGFEDRMPPSFFQPSDPGYQDVMIRFSLAGIEF
ncbi:hypothetical protein PTW35_22835 (plasmid) [Photobacterium sp. DA100]|uniref:hypothetical protein n=1 Tax=Photobacterium sp. DA100 TaxID=3027472 RepID=UPI002478ADDB|nr:hypothetical protein [Photobacterium sp. DA100]WEM44128.1 hypothetical protein PTW35_22835 [Photobacterium sp. DA100]